MHQQDVEISPMPSTKHVRRVLPDEAHFGGGDSKIRYNTIDP
jgi:hypothetical protein